MPPFKSYIRLKLFTSRIKLKYIWIVIQALFSGKLREGIETKKFESIFAKYVGANHAVFVSSARFGFYCILRWLNFKKGSEIILPGYTYRRVPEIICSLGLKPVFVDVSIDDKNIDTNLIEKVVSKRTKAIIATHILGTPCNIQKIKEIAKKYDLYAIEDCAHALGSEFNSKKVGSFGYAGFFSFGKEKNIDCLYSGGMVTTNSYQLAEYIKKEIKKCPKQNILFLLKNVLLSFAFRLKDYAIISNAMDAAMQPINCIFKQIFAMNGKKIGYSLKELEGYIHKPNNVQAIVGIHQMRILDKMQNKRIINSEYLNNKFSMIEGIKVIKPNKKARSVYLIYEIMVKNSYRIRKNFEKDGIETKGAYMQDCENIKMFKKYGRACKNSGKIVRDSIIIPNSEIYNIEDMERIISSAKNQK